MRKTGTLIVLLALISYSQCLIAQEDLTKLVLENNKSLQAARNQVEVLVLEARTGNTPSDPSVEMGFMAGSPTGTGSKLDFSVSQEFDFPSAYLHKSKLKEERTRHAELSYDMTRQEVLLEAKKLWVRGVFLNIQEKLLARRLQNAETLQDHFKQKLEAGEVSALSFSQANLQFISLKTDYEEILLLKGQNQLGINELCGGTVYSITENEFPVSSVLRSDSLLSAYEESPEMLYYQREKVLREREKSIALSLALPKLSAGYYSETVIDHQYKGLRIGFTVPLWENSNTIKAAKSKVVFASADAARYASIQNLELEQKLERASTLDLQIASLENALSEVNDEELLHMALESGEISLTEYIYSSELYFHNLLKLQELKRDRLMVEADLLKVYL